MRCRIIMTVVFDQPFYKGIFERFDEDQYAIAEINFGTNLPKVRDVYYFIINHWNQVKFTVIGKDRRNVHKLNPKRMQREAQKQVHARFCGSKAQQALQISFEKRKEHSRQEKRKQKQKRQRLQFKIRQAKKLQKHRGH